MTRPRFIVAAGVLLLLAFGLLIWRDEVRRPRYIQVPLERLASGEAGRLVGKRIVVEGHVAPTFGVFGGDYGVFEHYEGDRPSGSPAVIVRLRPGEAEPSANKRARLWGVLQASPNGLLLLADAQPPAPLWKQLLDAAVVAIAFAAGAGVLIIASRMLLRRLRPAGCAVTVGDATMLLIRLLSLIVCVAIAMLWVRSYWRSDVITWNTTNRPALRRQEYRIEFGRGALYVQRELLRFSTAESIDVYLRDRPMEHLEEGLSHFTQTPDDLQLFKDFPTYWGFGIDSWQGPPNAERVMDVEYGAVRWRYVGTRSRSGRSLTCPLWFLGLLGALIPARWTWVILRRHYRRTHGLCGGCGYSVRGNVSGVCPECGRPIISAAKA